MRIKPIAEMEAVDKEMDAQRKTTFQRECEASWKDVVRKAVRVLDEIQCLKEETDE